MNANITQQLPGGTIYSTIYSADFRQTSESVPMTLSIASPLAYSRTPAHASSSRATLKALPQLWTHAPADWRRFQGS